MEATWALYAEKSHLYMKIFVKVVELARIFYFFREWLKWNFYQKVDYKYSRYFNSRENRAKSRTKDYWEWKKKLLANFHFYKVLTAIIQRTWQLSSTSTNQK